MQFYTHLYRSLIHPNVCSDVNGEYMGADSQVHKTARKFYTSFSNWDTYRTQTALIAMLAPEETSDIVMLITYLPSNPVVASPVVLANIETGVMQGDPTPILVANAYAFGARTYDPRTLLRTMRYGAEVPGANSQGVFDSTGLGTVFGERVLRRFDLTGIYIF